MLLRPLTNDFENSVVDWKPTKDKEKPIVRVEHGAPAAQLYGFGSQWKTKVNVTHVAGPDSPIEEVTLQQGRDKFPLGPPYMATARDMYKIAVKWTEFVPKVHDDYPHLLAEMVSCDMTLATTNMCSLVNLMAQSLSYFPFQFAYCLAAAHVRLPHQVAKSFMVSDVYSGSEGWNLVDHIPTENVCYTAPRDRLPYVLHYCQRYLLGKWFIGKYRLPKDFISCESPMLLEPPSDIALRYNYSISPDQEERKYFSKQIYSHRYSFMICTMIKGLNDASEYFKKHNCGEDAIFDKSLTFHDTMEE